MFSDLKQLVTGVLVGVFAAGLIGMAILFSLTAPPSSLMGALRPSATPTSSHTPSPTGTYSPTPTATITLTPTFTPVPTLIRIQAVTSTLTPSATATTDPAQAALDNGSLVFSGPLSNRDQLTLYRASLKYIRTTAEGSKGLAKEVNGVGYGDPNNICGPLAIAILRDAGLMTPDIIPHDFWLLNPLAATDMQLLKKAFPLDRYIHAIIPTALNKIDWTATPLMPGDFLFIWHGSWGNFDHMLVVNRVDSSGRAYSVTNYGTPDGFLIAEAMLYDPADAAAGLFHQWTKQRDQILGSTGFGGYELWRRISP